MRAKVVVVAGPSGSGKSRLCRLVEDRLGLPTINLDDFYKDGSDPTLPRASIGPGQEIIDWDDPGPGWRRGRGRPGDAVPRRVLDLPVYEHRPRRPRRHHAC